MTLDLWSGCLFAGAFVAAFLLVLSAPRWAVVVLVASGPFSSGRYVGATTITLAKVALVASLAALVIRAVAGAGDREAISALRREPLFWCGAWIVAATAVTIAVAADRGAVVRESFKALQYLGVFAVAFVAMRLDAARFSALAALCVTVVLVALAALADLVTGPHSVLLVGSTVVPRIAGPLEGPNQLAGYLGLALPLAAAFTVRGDLRATVALALGLPTLILTLSRAGIATSLVALASVFALARSRTRGALRTTVVAALAGFLAVAAVSWHFAHSEGALAHILSNAEALRPGGVGTRKELWSGALVLWRRHPLLGIGAGNFENEIGPLERLPIRTHANSWFLQSLVEGGIPLFTASVVTVVVALVRLARGARGDPWVRGAFAATLGFTLHQIVDDLAFYPAVGTLWWLILGVAGAGVCERSTPRRV